MSHVTCLVSHVMFFSCFFLEKVVELRGGGWGPTPSSLFSTQSIIPLPTHQLQEVITQGYSQVKSGHPDDF